MAALLTGIGTHVGIYFILTDILTPSGELIVQLTRKLFVFLAPLRTITQIANCLNNQQKQRFSYILDYQKKRRLRN